MAPSPATEADRRIRECLDAKTATLDLSDLALSHLPNSLQAASHLTSLAICSREMTDLPEWLGNLSSLESLSIVGFNPSSPQEVYNPAAALHPTNFPDSLAGLTNLTTLDLTGNRLECIPPFISSLVLLTNLSLRDNQINSIPEFIANLERLEALSLKGNLLGEIPSVIGVLTHLTDLDVSNNEIVAIPKLHQNLRSLVQLKANSNEITEIHESISGLVNLNRLELGYNPIKVWPEAIFNLTTLTELGLEGCSLSQLPAGIGELVNLQRLDLWHNELTDLPKSLRMLGKLCELNVGGNTLNPLPQVIGELKSLTLLQLWGNGLTEIPEFISNLVNLTFLNLRSNRLTALPSALATLSNLTNLYLDNNILTEVPEILDNCRVLEFLDISGNSIQQLPDFVGHLDNLTQLIASAIGINSLPDSFAFLTKLTSLNLSGNGLQNLPKSIGSLTELNHLDLSGNELESLYSIGKLTKLMELDVSRNHIYELPTSLAKLTHLIELDVSHNELTTLPSSLGKLTNLAVLDCSFNSLTTLPKSMNKLTRLVEIDLGHNLLSEVPESLKDSVNLERLSLPRNQLRSLPDFLTTFEGLTELDLEENLLRDLPHALGEMPRLGILSVKGNPLPPELSAAAEESHIELMDFLRLLNREGEYIHEAKLILVGEGAVGKSSLLSTLCNEEWVEDRDTTHGIEIKRFAVRNDDTTIMLNGWDFGGQPVYRPTHQLFFSAPAVYLVVWKPREGPEQGFVDYWLTLIKHRAGTEARVLIVATHGGPGARSAYLNEAQLRERYGDMIVGFCHVDSKNRVGIEALTSEIAKTAAALPYVGRWYPETWYQLRSDLSTLDRAYLHYDEYLALAAKRGIKGTAARSLARNSHSLGYWINYADDPGLSDLIILKADWLSTAISFVLDDPETIDANGLLPHRRLSLLWNDPIRAPEFRYSRALHPLFLRLMEKFNLSYRITIEEEREEPLSLVAQLVRGDQPDLTQWHTAIQNNEEERVQVCEIVEAETGDSVVPEGLMYQLIVRFHRFSLGRNDYRNSVHWQNGMILDDSYNGRALVSIDRNRVTIRVRAAYPQFFLYRLMQDIRSYVETFWKGLHARIMVPCIDPCGLGEPGRGLFETIRLISSRGRGRREFPCSVCDEWQDIDMLLLGATIARGGDADHLAQVIRDALAPDFARVLAGIGENLVALGELSSDLRKAVSQAEERFEILMSSLDDDARDGPRLFSVIPVGKTLWKPGWTSQRVRIELWCQHSRLPVYMLDSEESRKGIYDMSMPRDWLVAAAPWIRATSVVLESLLPISLSALRMTLPQRDWKSLKNQLLLSREALDALSDLGERMPALDSANVELAEELDDDSPSFAETSGAKLRVLHALLRELDPSFAGLERVRDERDRYIWVHPRFVHYYRPSLPEIPV